MTLKVKRRQTRLPIFIYYRGPELEMLIACNITLFRDGTAAFGLVAATDHQVKGDNHSLIRGPHAEGGTLSYINRLKRTKQWTSFLR